MGSASFPSLDVDLFTDANILEPYDAYREVRDAGPIVWLSRHQAWSVARYDVVRRVLRDVRSFTSVGGVSLNNPLNAMLRGTTLASDAPVHDTLRNIVASSLTPRAMASRKSSIDQLADHLVANLVERGRFDVVSDLARVLQLNIVPDFVGLPKHGRDRMLKWASAMFNAIGPLNARAKRGFRRCRRWLHTRRSGWPNAICARAVSARVCWQPLMRGGSESNSARACS